MAENIEVNATIRWGSKFPFFSLPNSIFDMDIQVKAYERANHGKGAKKVVVTRGIKPVELLVYIYLARCCNNCSQDAFPSYATISRKCKLSHGTVFEAIDTLVKTGLLVRQNRQKTRGQHVSNQYLLIHPEALQPKDSKNTMSPGDNIYTARRQLKRNNKNKEYEKDRQQRLQEKENKYEDLFVV